jgi:type IV secretory pathway ATPase VirB11/archaellum biosynthesis ATPase/intein/homing endonuclease
MPEEPVVKSQYTVKVEGGKRYLIIDCRGSPYGPSIIEYPQRMAEVIDLLGKTDADMVVLSEVYERVYDEDQTKMLKQIAAAAQNFRIKGVWSPAFLGGDACDPFLAARHDIVVNIASDLIRTDPIKAYITCLDVLKKERDGLPNLPQQFRECTQAYINTLEFVRATLEATDLILKLKDYIRKLRKLPPARGFYHTVFEAQLKPSFIGSRLMFKLPEQIELLDQYQVAGSTVTIYKHPEKIEYLYHLNPPEYQLSPEHYFLMTKTREIVSEYHPEGLEFTELASSKDYFKKIYETTIADLARQNNIEVTPVDVKALSEIVARYTIGFGIMGLLLSDERLTDVYIDAPLGLKPVYVVHSDYGPCQTNVFFAEEEANSVVSRFRSLSGRPFDEAHSVLDFDLHEFHTRTATIGPPLSSDGVAFALRIHKGTPWTLPQFIDVKMMTPEIAGLLSFLIDAQASSLIVGSRGSGKTSMLMSLMLEILPSLRVITIEDSVAGDSRIPIRRNGRTELTTVGKLVDEQLEMYGSQKALSGHDVLSANPDKIEVYSMDKNGKIALTQVGSFIRHKVGKKMYDVRTRTGKSIKVTADHSLFTLGSDGNIKPVKTGELREGDYIATPRTLRVESTRLESFNALERLPAFGKAFLVGGPVKQLLAQNRDLIFRTALKQGFAKVTVQRWFREGILPAKTFAESGLRLEPPGVFIKSKYNAKTLPALIDIDEDFLQFAGLWLADGCYDANSVIVSVVDEVSRAVVRRVAAKLGLPTKMHSDGISLMINSKTLKALMQALELKGNAYTKRLPSWAFGLPKQQLAALLRGLYSGDGYLAKSEVGMSLASEDLVKGVQTALLAFGVISRINRLNPRDKTRSLRISALESLRLFESEIGFLQEDRCTRLALICRKQSTHDSSDIIPLSREFKAGIAESASNFNRYDYLTRNYSIGRRRLGSLQLQDTSLKARLDALAESDIFWDQITEIVELPAEERYVYDFSIPGKESFVCENIVAHNTLELPVEYMRKVGYNILRLKTRSAISVGAISSEVSPEDALRTALRLGDSVLIVGEVRSKEALVLYEAMRVGAVGNVVMGTIHAENAYSVWDRVVNDLGVPNTSFKATDMAIVAAPIRFKGSLKKVRRLIEITEIGKTWYEDPLREGGLLPLMEYDATTDTQRLLKENIFNNSQFFKKIQRLRGIDMETIWQDIQHRAAQKQFMVEMKREHGIPELLEAEWYVRANDKYLLMQEESRTAIGYVDYPGVLEKWKEWLREGFVKELVARRQALEKLKTGPSA